MKNRFIIISVLINCILMAAPVALNKAQRVAENIYAERSNTGIIDGFNLRSIDIIDENAVNLLYVFQLESEGFILVPGDDRVQPLLAYSFESPFFIEDVPQNVAWMIDAYKDVVRYAIESDESPTEKVNAAWEKYNTGNGLNIRNRDMKGPLLLSHWNQSGAWNDYCPGETECGGDQVPSGCVAVSMAAIMHYWAYPLTGEGENQCYCGGYGTQSADFSEAFYDYAAMEDAVSGSDAASFLVWHAAIGVNMDYDCEGSGAQVTGGYPSAEYAMKNYFKYKSSIYDTAPYSWSDSEWVAKLQNEISANRPFIYVGYNDEGGHAWNCDGYDGELFHMNWGWGGQSDGWFMVTGPDDPDGWGGGSHVLINIEPEELNRPNLRLTAYSANETSGDGDAVINPGETFEIVFELENPAPWSAASSIEIILATEDDGVHIDESTSYILSSETLQPGEIFSNASMPFIVDVDGDIELGDKTFNLMIMGIGIEGAEDNFYYKEYELEVLVSINQFGFPVYEASQKTSPLAVDFDGDGTDEIIYGDYNGYIHVINSDGSEIVDENFPFATGDQVWGAVAGADMDGDGLMDIVATSKSKHLYILDKNGLKVDYNAESWLLGTPAIGNIDGDEDLEVVVGGFSSEMKKIFAINPDGSDVSGYPLDIGERMYVGIALADFDGNGRDDIIVGTESDNLHLFYDDGSEAPGFPYQVGDKMRSAPSILDVDGQKVIFVGSNDNHLYAVNSDGSLRFSIATTDKVFNSPAFLEHNNTFYVFFSDNSGLLYAVDTDGNSLDGWPVGTGTIISKSVAFADLDGDGSAEVIAATEFGDILVFNLDGSLHSGFPMSGFEPFFSSPIIIDMDDDDDLEVLAGSGSSLVSLDIKNSGSSSGYWSIYRGSTKRTGYYNISEDESCANDFGDVNEDGTVNILDIVLVANAVLGSSLSGCGLEAADMNGDGALNILDIVLIANAILSPRGVDATSVEIKRIDDALRLIADGYIGGIQMTLKHGSDFAINLTKYALHADYRTEDNKTTLIVVVPEREEIFTYLGDFEITDMMIANSRSEIKMNVPGKFEINQAYPNPFNPSTSINLHMPVSGDVNVEVYDLNGRLVQTLLYGMQSEGDYDITWNARNQSSGMYLIRATMGKQTAIQKVLLLK